MYCTYLVMPVSADGLGIVFGCLTIKLIVVVVHCTSIGYSHCIRAVRDSGAWYRANVT